MAISQDRTKTRRRVDIRKEDGHESWRGIYALCGVDSSIEPDTTTPDTDTRKYSTQNAYETEVSPENDD